MDSKRIEWITKILVAIAFFIGAGFVAWHGRTYQTLQPDYLVPFMCLMVALMFSMTGFALILRDDE